MFPLEFPLNVLKSRACRHQRVLDPFCGRGTTNFAARLLGLESLGVDSSPVAAAITASKLVNTTPEAIVAEARSILNSDIVALTPDGAFWRWAYHSTVLDPLCRLRRAFSLDCSTPSRVALRGIILGALHGPKQKTFQSYFSNQSPRTYAPKPAYSLRFWKSRRLRPEPVDLLKIIERRAERYFSALPPASGSVRLSDSRRLESLAPGKYDRPFNWVITSPPYYGMRTYLPDQWLRNWMVGGSDRVDYNNHNQIVHWSPEDFVNDLRTVWRNAAKICSHDATLVVRFGGIADRKASPRDLIKQSLKTSGWTPYTIREAGSATRGKRQANTFLRIRSTPILEYDIWARKSTPV
jgi:hypothetical protein